MARKKEKKELENKNQEEKKVEITVEPTEEIEQSSEESVEIEEDKNIEETVEPSVSEEPEEDTVEPTEISFPELENTEPVENNKFEPIEKEIISLDNSPISPLIQEEKEIIPEKFVNITPKKVEHENKINIKNKRVYKDLGNGYGMYSDDGSIFKI